MKRVVFGFLAVVVMTGSAFASAELVKERAKQQRDLNNQQQGVAPPPPPAATPHPPSFGSAPSSSQGISAAQQSLIDRLQADFTIVKLGTEATAEQKQRLQVDIATLAKGSMKPSSASLGKLAGHLAVALSEKQVSANDLAKVSRNINIVVNCGSLTPARAAIFANDTQLILKNAGVSAARAQAVGNDLTAIINEIQKAKPKLYQ